MSYMPQSDVTAAISIAANATSSGVCTSGGGACTYTFQLTGTFTATVQVQVTRDGTNWVNLTGSNGIVNLATGAYLASGNITAVGIYQASITGVAGARLITTAYTSGTVVGTAAISSTPALTALEGVAAVSQSGTWTAQIGNTPNTTPILATQVPKTSGGCSLYTGSIGATATTVKASAGQLYGYHFFNSNSTVAYVQIFNLLVGSVTLGTTTPTLSIGIPVGGSVTLALDSGIVFSTGIAVACTTTRTGSTALTNTVDLNVFYL